MIITKLVNNNVLIAMDEKDGEVVVMGKGLAYRGKVGDIVNESMIERVFVVKNNNMLDELLQDIPLVYLGITEEIVKYANDKYQMTMNESIYLGLTDHIYYAVKRLKDDDIHIDNPFELEIKNFFQEEWDIGQYGQKLLTKEFNLQIPDSEAAYIAMHIIECRYNITKKNTSEELKLINELITIIKDNYPTPLSNSGLAYNRLVTHVKYFIRRYLANQESSDDEILDDVYINKFDIEYQCTEKISEYLLQRYGKKMSASEMSYIILHLRNCRNYK